MIILEGWMEEGGRSREEHGVVQTESVQKEVHQDDYPPQVRAKRMDRGHERRGWG